jgi:hypothetical protein
MSRPDHIVSRFQSTMGDSWWWRRYADLIDRKNGDGTYKPFDGQAARRLMMTKRNRRKYAKQIAAGLPIEHKLPFKHPKPITEGWTPAPVERPPGMTRQAQRRLYREACKVEGVSFHKEHTEKTPRRLRGMTPVQRALREEAEWQAFKAQFVTIQAAPDPDDGV